MIDRICSICGEYVTDTWTLVLSDDKDEKREFTGHKSCVDDLDNKVKSIKDVHKLPVTKVLKQLNLK